MPKRQKVAPKPAAGKPAAKGNAVNARGTEWIADKLTGNRSQRGTQYQYEVQWQNRSNGEAWPNTWEPPGHLVGWEKEQNLDLLNFAYDLTPSQYITVVVTEVGMVPPTSVPVIIREVLDKP